LVTFGSFIYRQADMQDCTKAAALAEFMYWTQTSDSAQQIASRFYPLSSLSLSLCT
jgi:predicted secreted protein